jgi:hypothetical protein
LQRAGKHARWETRGKRGRERVLFERRGERRKRVLFIEGICGVYRRYLPRAATKGFGG